MVKIKRILCAVDFSEFSRHALDHALALARSYKAEVTVLHVYPASPPPVSASGFQGEVPLLPAEQPDEVAAEVRQFCQSEPRGTDTPLDIVVLGGQAPRV